MELLWAISELRSPFGDKLVQMITYLGEELFLISVICALYWCFNKKLATQIGLTFITSGMLVQGLKITFRIPRPWVLDPTFEPVGTAIEAATGYSFPSGHTQSATSLFAPLAFYTKKFGLKIFFTICFLLVAFSRMYLGVHTCKDVSVAVLLTCTISFLIDKYQVILIDKVENTRKLCVSILGVGIALCCYSPILHHFGLIEAHYVDDCYKIAGAAIGFAIAWYLERTKLNFSTEHLSSREKIMRFVIGLTTTAILYIVPKLFFKGVALWKMLRYFAVIFWIIYAYPYLFTKYKK